MTNKCWQHTKEPQPDYLRLATVLDQGVAPRCGSGSEFRACTQLMLPSSPPANYRMGVNRNHLPAIIISSYIDVYRPIIIGFSLIYREYRYIYTSVSQPFLPRDPKCRTLI